MIVMFKELRIFLGIVFWGLSVFVEFVVIELKLIYVKKIIEILVYMFCYLLKLFVVVILCFGINGI